MYYPLDCTCFNSVVNMYFLYMIVQPSLDPVVYMCFYCFILSLLCLLYYILILCMLSRLCPLVPHPLSISLGKMTHCSNRFHYSTSKWMWREMSAIWLLYHRVLYRWTIDFSEPILTMTEYLDPSRVGLTRASFETIVRNLVRRL